MTEKTELLDAAVDDAVSEEAVVAYLRQHPDFFNFHEDVLASMRLPHQRGGTVSLVERQMDVLRQRLRGAQGQLQDLIGVARENEQLFNRTRRLTLGLLECEDLEALAELVQDRFRTDFATDMASLILISPETSDDNLPRIASEQLSAELDDIFRLGRARAGKLPAGIAEQVFPLDPGAVASALLCPILEPAANSGGEPQPLALLALGSLSEDYFHDDLDTTFLDYVRDVLMRRLLALARNRESDAG